MTVCNVERYITHTPELSACGRVLHLLLYIAPHLLRLDKRQKSTLTSVRRHLRIPVRRPVNTTPASGRQRALRRLRSLR